MKLDKKIVVDVRKGTSKDPRYEYYPEQYWQVKCEDGEIQNVSPTHENTCDMLIDIAEHEIKVDITRSRQPYAPKFLRMLEVRVAMIKEMIKHGYEKEEIEEIYNEINTKKN